MEQEFLMTISDGRSLCIQYTKKEPDYVKQIPLRLRHMSTFADNVEFIYIYFQNIPKNWVVFLPL